MVTRYDALYYASAPLLVPYLAWRSMQRGKYRRSAPAMLGRGLDGVASDRFARGSVWVHAVSVGEVAAAKAIEPGLRRLFPDLPLVLSTITETGQASARRSLPGAEAHLYFPADFSWNVRRFISVYRPKVVILMETEIWPNFVTLARGAGAELFMVNGKLSDRSFPRYRRFRRFLAPVFGAFTGICAQTEENARRFAEVGVDPERIRVTGNCKLDLEIEALGAEDRARLRSELGIAPDRPVVVVGSTHPEEERLTLDAFEAVRREVPGVCLVWAPRHPDRFGEVAAAAAGRGFDVARASESVADRNSGSPVDVVILDKMGVLARTYGIADVAVVAGSFCKTGGHNLFEAAAHSIPVIHGPNMRSQREIERLFTEADAGTRVTADQLAPAMIRFLKDPELRAAEGRKARDVLEANQGSAERAVGAIEAWLKAAG